MKGNSIWKVTTGVLVLALVIFNGVMPYMQHRKAMAYAERAQAFAVQLKNANDADKATLINQFVSQEAGKDTNFSFAGGRASCDSIKWMIQYNADALNGIKNGNGIATLDFYGQLIDQYNKQGCTG